MRPWVPTTHDWTSDVDTAHLGAIRAEGARYAPGGVLHLVLEGLAYPADEATATEAGSCDVTLHADGSLVGEGRLRAADVESLVRRLDGPLR